MSTIIVAVFAVMMLFQTGIIVWFAVKALENDQDYENSIKAINKMYRRKKTSTH